MSAYAVTRLAWDLEHVDGLRDRFDADPDPVLDGYALTPTERAAIVDRDAPALLAGGVNPVALRNLMVLLGAAGAQMYVRSHLGVDRTGGPA
ncbi:hypothetical protein [Phytohabitans kaempferiae]|uniref:Extradiol ring-cleavage dioxygenase LigAB LigA subunit domain-containing protein n=1 Tax=Phytohabitans kaempferiae TaxID=1620943 RepID=A0ABV6LZJ2_9ACTN